jgi:hypothetical protein
MQEEEMQTMDHKIKNLEIRLTDKDILMEDMAHEKNLLIKGIEDERLKSKTEMKKAQMFMEDNEMLKTHLNEQKINEYEQQTTINELTVHLVINLL